MGVDGARHHGGHAVLPRALGWTGAAALPAMSGSTQRVPLLRQASLPMLGVYTST
jgi:hypothetical protein